MARGRGDYQYDDAFRAEAVSLVIEKKLTLRKAAEQVGVSYETLRKWIEGLGARQRMRNPKVTSKGLPS